MANSKKVAAIMTSEEVANRWGISTKTVRSMLHNGTLRGFKTTPGAAKAPWRILTSEVEKFERGEAASV